MNIAPFHLPWAANKKRKLALVASRASSGSGIGFAGPQAARPPRLASEPHEVGSVRARSADRPPLGGTAPSGGSEPHEVGSVGAP